MAAAQLFIKPSICCKHETYPHETYVKICHLLERFED